MRPDAPSTSEHKYLSQFSSGQPTVLVAEDSDDICYVLSQELQHRGCRVLTVSDGCEAVETALSVRIQREVHVGEPGVRMAARAELTRIVAVAARRFALVRLHRVRHEKADTVVPGRCICRARPVTIEALGPCMAGRAGLRPGRCGRSVGLGKIRPV